ncbi:MAG: transglycosylase SLT domain-containing protein [Desulfobacteraceae bacterium]|nr:transglycosylase SLT domain-containing protein [Desulfobacteraceae bacterium]
MNRLHPYSAFLLALVAGTAFLVSALTAGPLRPRKDESRHEKSSALEKDKVLLADRAAADGQAALHLGNGLAEWWTREGGPSTTLQRGEPLLPLPGIPSGGLSLRAVTGRIGSAGGTAGGTASLASSLWLGEDFDRIQARKFKECVERHAARFRIKPNLVFAIMKAESHFDALAVSTASAQGLMQLVPATGGRIAYRMVYGKDMVPSRKYLLDPSNNIELGTAYLRHLAEVYFNAVESPDSRDYCLIAAYNTGPANVYRAFGGDYERAMARINSLSPPQVLAYLKSHLPCEETRNYLAKVVSSRREFFDL